LIADLDVLLALVESDVAQPVEYFGSVLDSDIAGVIRGEKRFRNHLSEHISFWVRLASEPERRRDGAQADAHAFGHSRPNVQPEDKGPDGLFLSLLGACPSVELLSIKSSTKHPQRLISLARFRDRGEIDENRRKQPLLEEFCMVAHRKVGLLRLDEKLSHLCRLLGLGADQERRAALLTQTKYNGVIFADEEYADENLFTGFRHVAADASRCIATYIGSAPWESLAKRVRRHVVDTLRAKGLL